MQAPARRTSNVSGMLAGRYRYTDFPGADPQWVDVTYEHGEAVVRFADMEPEDVDLELLRRDMAGEFEGPLR